MNTLIDKAGIGILRVVFISAVVLMVLTGVTRMLGAALLRPAQSS